MAQHRGRPAHVPRAAITPRTRGAAAPSSFPFRIPPPAGSGTLSEEQSLFSQSGMEQPATQRRGTHIIGNRDAARARMTGQRPPADVEVDLLGEADVLERAAEGAAAEQEQEQENQEQEVYIDDEGGVSDISEVEALKAQVKYLAASLKQTQAPQMQAPPPAAAPQKWLNAQPVVIEDTDRLWDWLRADAQSGYRFFGATFTNSMSLHNTVRALQQAEDNGVGLLRAIYVVGQSPSPQHIGFVMLNPIMTDERVALAHVYLRADVRGRLAQLLPSLLQLAAQEMPEFRIAVLPADVTQRRLYESLLGPLGFVAHTILVK